MERRVSKRRRLHSTEPNTLVARNEFARKYVKCLVPALMMINRKDMSSSRNQPLDKAVRRQVNMALAFSASGFAWGSALKRKLQESASNSNVEERKPAIDEKQSQDYDSDDEGDEKIIGEKLERLKSIIPGGNEIESVPALLGELGCYITCLQSQVNVLRCLADH